MSDKKKDVGLSFNTSEWMFQIHLDPLANTYFEANWGLKSYISEPKP